MMDSFFPFEHVTIQIPKALQDVKPEYNIPLTSPYGTGYLNLFAEGKSESDQPRKPSAHPGGESVDK